MEMPNDLMEHSMAVPALYSATVGLSRSATAGATITAEFSRTSTPSGLKTVRDMGAP